MCCLYWFSGPGCCSSPSFHLRLGASDSSPALAFCCKGPWTFAWIRCPQLPHHPCKNGTHSTSFYSTGGTRRLQRSLGPSGPEMPKESQTCLPRPLAPDPEKSPKSPGESGNSPESLQKVSGECFLTPFEDFSTCFLDGGNNSA